MSDAGGPQKKRRLQGACDACRTKKTKCDSANMPGNVCSNCLSFGTICTHNLANKRKKRTFLVPRSAGEGADDIRFSPNNAPIRSKVAEIQSRAKAGASVIPEDRAEAQKLYIDMAQYIASLEKELTLIQSSSLGSSTDSTPALDSQDTDTVKEEESDSDDACTDDEQDDAVLAENMKLLAVTAAHGRFFGKSSSLSLVQTALDVKKCMDIQPGTQVSSLVNSRRNEFWNVNIQPQWEWFPAYDPPPLIFPPEDLMKHLLDMYYYHVHLIFPIVHWPTLQRLLSSFLHHRDYYFGCTVIAICALGARYSNDPRVLDGEISEHQAGWKWFKQVKPAKRSLLEAPSVYELQLYVLCILYLQGTSTTEAGWTLIGLGIRIAQEVGAHRKSMGESKPKGERELWKRAFWALVTTDIYISAFMGRARALNPLDFDQEYPLDCDDEYWDHPDPNQAFKQPHGKPSKVSAWIHLLKLLNILSFAQSTIFAVKQTDLWKDMFQSNEHKKVIVKIDSSLNEWIDSIPDHLRWDPQKSDPLWLDQSALLYTSYYYVQIVVHRPFVISSKLRTSASFAYLAICANAARSCCRVMDIQTRHGRLLPLPNITASVFNAGIVLLLNAWGGRRLGFPTNYEKEIQDCHRCVQILRTWEKRWQVAGRLCDLLSGLISMGDLPANVPASNLKRPRDDPEGMLNLQTFRFNDSVFVSPQTTSTGFSPIPARTPFQMSHTPPETQQSASLPLYTSELGSLPLYGTFDFPEDSLHWVSHGSPESTSGSSDSTGSPSGGNQAKQLPPDFWTSLFAPASFDTTSSLAQEFPGPQSSSGNSISPTTPGVDQQMQRNPMFGPTPAAYDANYWNSYLTGLEEIMQSARGAYPTTAS